jgi:hypothetical protein
MRKLSILFVAAVGACGHGGGEPDDLIGNACSVDQDCEELCAGPSGDFPGGFCTIGCRDDRDCTGDTFCVEKEGGICLFDCDALDCRDLGPGWDCRDTDRVGGGKVFVCRGD